MGNINGREDGGGGSPSAGSDMAAQKGSAQVNYHAHPAGDGEYMGQSPPTSPRVSGSPLMFTPQNKSAAPVTKEELGQATWTFLHTLAAHYPDTPTKQQKVDVKELNKSAAPVTKEELGRATWTFLHTLAAQYPDKPTRQQKADVKELMAILSRMYPCKECADHFKEVLRGNPVHASSQAELSQWLCRVHNVVNRSLDKPRFPCERVDARWGKLDCEQRACDLLGDTTFSGSEKY